MNATSFPTWLREPLLHFAVLGALLFGIDSYLVGRSTDPHLIVVDESVDRDAIEIWKGARGVEPTAEELAALRKVWLQNEVLYREGLAMQVDKGDSAIRDRIIFKALSVIDANVRIPDVDDAVLSHWFEEHRAKYDEPQRVNFQEAVLDGDNSEKAVRDFVAQLNKGTRGDAKAGLRVFKDRPVLTITQSYGDQFLQALLAAPTARWLALQGKDGWRAIFIDTVTPAKPAVLAEIRNVVVQDWKDEIGAKQRSTAVDELIAKYKVRYSKSAP